jgi:hypothetical protein
VGIVHHEYAPADDDPIFDNASFADAGQVTNQYAFTQADAVIKNSIGPDNRAGTDLEWPASGARGTIQAARGQRRSAQDGAVHDRTVIAYRHARMEDDVMADSDALAQLGILAEDDMAAAGAHDNLPF